jgi:hypothetical protein
MKIEDVSTEDLATVVAGLVRAGVTFRVNATMKGDWIITLTGGF